MKFTNPPTSSINNSFMEETFLTNHKKGPKLKIVFSCQWSFNTLRPYKIINLQPIPDSPQCSKIGYQANLLETVLRSQYLTGGINTIGIPTQEWEMPAWLNISRDYPVVMSSKNTMEILGNKLEFKQFMLQSNFGAYVPIQYHSYEDAKYPCIVKLNPITGTNSQGIHIVYNTTHLQNIINLYSTLNEPYLLEEAVISKNEVCFSIVAYNGKLLKSDDCLHFNPKSNKLEILDRKMRYRRKRVSCPTLPNWEIVDKITLQIVQKSRFNGIACLQYKYTELNEIKVLEVNPRLCAGLTRNLPVLAEFIWLWWKEFVADDKSMFQRHRYSHSKAKPK